MNWIDKIYIISLERHDNRRKSIKLDLLTAGFDESKIEWIDAVDGNSLNIDECLKDGTISNTFTDPYGVLTKSIYGCALSHQLVYKKFLETSPEIQNCLILEDDASVSHTLLRVLLANSLPYEKLLEEKNKFDWDVIVLGGQEKQIEHINTNSYVLKRMKRYPRDYAAHSYIITKKGAMELINNNKSIQFAADVNIHCSNVKLYCTPTSYFLQKEGDFERWLSLRLESRFKWNVLYTKEGWDREEVVSSTTYGDYFIEDLNEKSYKTAQISSKIPVDGVNWNSFTAPNGDVIEGWTIINLKVKE